MSEGRSVREDNIVVEQSGLISQIESAKLSRCIYFEYTEIMDSAYRMAALLTGKQVGFGEPPAENTRNHFRYTKKLDRKYDQSNPDPFAEERKAPVAF